VSVATQQAHPKILADRLAQIEALSLSSGSHEEFESGMCVMEAVSYITGEPWGDAPQCACPVITSFMVAWNDGLPNDEDRGRLLKPLIPQIVGTRSTPEVEARRSYMALDWLIRVHTPKFLGLVPELAHHAKALRDLDAIVDMAGATAAGARVRAARDAAWAAAWAAAGDAARAAAGAAAGAAAWAAARAALAPSVTELQASAGALVLRMIAEAA
jgi:hypothetical protein